MWLSGGAASPSQASLTTTVTQTGTRWKHEPDADTPQIPLVNILLNGFNVNNDFWSYDHVEQFPVGGGFHRVGEPEPVPSISTYGLGLLSFVLMSGTVATLRRRGAM